MNGHGPRWRRILFAYAYEGASRAWGLVFLGLVLDALSTPPGPAPFLVLAADAPYLGLLFLDGGRRWKRWAFLYALLHYSLGFHWLALIHPVQVAGAAVGLTPVALAAAFAIRFLVKRRVSIVLAAPAVLVLEEIMRTIWMGGMPLPSRALPLAGSPELVASTAWLGAWSLVFLAGLSGAVLYRLPHWMRAATRSGRSPSLPVAGGVALVLVLGGGLWLLGSARLGAGAPLASTEPGVLLAVQGNVAQSLKHSLDPDAGNKVLERHLALTEAGLRSARGAGREPFAVLWPETMITWPFFDAELAHRYPDRWENQVRVLRRIQQVATENPPPPRFLLGAIHLFRRGDELHLYAEQYGNHDSMFFVDPSLVRPADRPYPDPPPVGEVPPWELGRHDKHALVPGGEYTPAGEFLPPLRWFRNFVSVIPELEKGAVDQPLFELRPAREDTPAVTAGTVICFELLFPARCRHWRRAGADVLLNAANYGWFGESAFRPQIRAVARLRAAETATTVVVAGNTGPTLFYDPRGRPYGTFFAAQEGASRDPSDDESTFRAGWAWGPLLLDPEPTPYVRVGDLPWWLLGTALLFLAILRTARTGDAPVTVSTYEEKRSEGEGENL